MKYFDKRHIQVIEASDGHMGLSLMNKDIQLVLLDIMMLVLMDMRFVNKYVIIINHLFIFIML